jgi:uncharacterized protein
MKNIVEIPYQDIKPDTLHNLLEEFVTREGTDYGDLETSLQIKVDQVKNQLIDGSARICFDSDEMSWNIIKKKG